jgi:hypothetical protein
MPHVGNTVRLTDSALKFMRADRKSAVGRARGKVVSTNSPFGERWIEVKWSGKMLTHRYDLVHHLEVIKKK